MNNCLVDVTNKSAQTKTAAGCRVDALVTGTMHRLSLEKSICGSKLALEGEVVTLHSATDELGRRLVEMMRTRKMHVLRIAALEEIAKNAEAKVCVSSTA